MTLKSYVGAHHEEYGLHGFIAAAIKAAMELLKSASAALPLSLVLLAIILLPTNTITLTLNLGIVTVTGRTTASFSLALLNAGGRRC